MNQKATALQQTDTMTIGELARRARVSTHTVRYYEKIGVLQNHERAPNGYRIYTDRDLYAIRLVRRAKLLGLSLAEIKEIAPTLWEDPSERKLIERSVDILTSHKETARKKLREIESYVTLLEGEIERLKGLL